MGQPFLIGIAGVGKAFWHLGMGAGERLPRELHEGRLDGVSVAEVDDMPGVIHGDHHLVELLSWPDADDPDRQAGCQGFGEVGHLHRGDLRHEDFPAPHDGQGGEDEVDPLAQGDPEARHARVGNRQIPGALGDQALEQGRHRASRADNVPIPDHGEAGADVAGQVVSRHEGLVRGQLGGPIQVGGVAGLVGGQGDDLLHPVCQGCPDDVLRPQDVGLDEFRRVVLSGGHLLEGGGVHHHVHPAEGQGQPLAVADVTQEEPHAAHLLGGEPLGHVDLHFVLLQLVPGKDDQLARLGPAEHGIDEAAAEGSGPAGHEDGLALQFASVCGETVQLRSPSGFLPFP